MRHDLTSLELFVAVAECGNLTRAAERQHLAVSAVSKRIAELEDIAGTALLVRYPRGVMLTPAGQSLLQHARQMLQLVQKMDADLAEYAGGIKGHIRLHAVASALLQFLPSELQNFVTRYPLVQVSVEERVGRAVVRAVAEGAADLGIVATVTPLEGLHATPYRRDTLMLGVPVGHPLSASKAVRFAEALDYPFVGPHADSSLSRMMKEAARAGGKPLRQRIQVSSFEVMCRLVQSGLGISPLPEGVLAPHAAAGEIQVVRLQEDWNVRQLVIVVRDIENVEDLTRTLIDHLCRGPAIT